MLLTFSEINKNSSQQVGGKAINLARLTQAGVEVPPGFSITTEIFWQFLEENSLTKQLQDLAQFIKQNTISEEKLNTKLDSLRQAIISGKFADNVILDIKQKLLQFPDESRFAVRSSATSEDLESASFAGQYDTFLNVSSLEENTEKIKMCFASYWNTRAFQYRSDKGIDHFVHGMSVIVQQLIDADIAGVVFTLNPLTGNEREMVIEACWGLGEALVSGAISPDRYVVDPFEKQIQSIKAGHKALKLVSDNKNGVKEINLEEREANSLTLSDKAVLELAEISIAVQKEYGAPMDIEWAAMNNKFYILQARALTAFSFAPDIGQWTSANFREVMPGVVNPLSFSLSLDYDYRESLKEFLLKVGLYKQDKPIEWSRRFFARAYWNVDIVKTCAAKVPGYSERAFDITVGIDPSYSGNGVETHFTLSNIIGAIPIFFRLQWLYYSFWREAKNYVEEYEVLDQKLLKNDYKTFSDNELVKQTQEVIALHYQTNRIAMICSFLATESQNDFRQYIDKINNKLPAEHQISIANLLTGLSEISTAGPLVELWTLATMAKENTILRDIIINTNAKDLISACEALSEEKNFTQKLKDYLEKYQFLAANDEDLACLRWADDNSFPLTILKNYVQSELNQDPLATIKKQRESREQEQAKALANIGLFERYSFMSKLNLVAHYCRWREITRVPLSKTYYQCQRVFLEQGQRMVNKGVLEKKEDIFWLEREELLSFLSGNLSVEDVQTRIKKAKLIADCYRNFHPPTVIGQGQKLNTAKRKIVSSGQKFFGVACSAGEVVASARVIHNLSEASKLQHGEIMIAPHTNPGWTPLFSLASAVVLEEGGLLSHGAVVARECGIPTVLQIKHATEIFYDGQLLRVNGSSGEVEILSK